MWTTFLQILIPLILAAFFGYLFGRWWTKRWYEDVTETYDELKTKSRSTELKDVLTKADLDDRIASLSSSVASIPAPNLDPLDRRLSSIESSFASFTVPETDLTPIYERMTRIDQRLAQPSGDLGRLESRLSRLEDSIGEVSRRVSALHNTDLDPIQSRFNRLERSLNELEIDAPDMDLGPIHSGLAQLELAIAEIDVPQTDLSPIQEQLTGLELRVVDLADRIEEARGEDFVSIQSELGGLQTSLATMAAPDLDPIERRLLGVERAVDGIQLPDTDLGPLFSRLERLEQRLLEPSNEYQNLYARLAGMEAAIDALDRGPLDFTPMHERLSHLETMISALRSDVHGIPSLEPVERELASLQRSILSIPQPDLSPVVASVRSVEGRLDMAAMENRLTAIEYGLTAVHHMLRSRQDVPAPVSTFEPELYAQGARPTAPSRTVTETYTSSTNSGGETTSARTYTARPSGDPIASARRPNDQSNLLMTAAFGEPDDLERISGVGPMLSDMLQDVGVYYFWQIAEWDQSDIVWVDDKLEHFKGRIERDNWVGQARQFAAEPHTANRPL